MSMGVEDKVFLLHLAQAVGIHSYVSQTIMCYIRFHRERAIIHNRPLWLGGKPI